MQPLQLTLRPAGLSDAESCHRLSAAVGWAHRREDWALPDPKHFDDDGYRAVRDEIAERVKTLLAEL